MLRYARNYYLGTWHNYTRSAFFFFETYIYIYRSQTRKSPFVTLGLKPHNPYPPTLYMQRFTTPTLYEIETRKSKV